MKLKKVNVNDLDNLLGKIELIDIREPFEVSRKAIKTSKNIPMDTLLDNPENYLDKNKEYYIVCQSGMRSSKTASELQNIGYKVVDVAGGTGSYIGTKLK